MQLGSQLRVRCILEVAGSARMLSVASETPRRRAMIPRLPNVVPAWCMLVLDRRWRQAVNDKTAPLGAAECHNDTVRAGVEEPEAVLQPQLNLSICQRFSHFHDDLPTSGSSTCDNF